MTNENIRRAMKDNGVFQWQVAEALKISEGSFCRKLRHELPEKEQTNILNIVSKLAAAEVQ